MARTKSGQSLMTANDSSTLSTDQPSSPTTPRKRASAAGKGHDQATNGTKVKAEGDAGANGHKTPEQVKTDITVTSTPRSARKRKVVQYNEDDADDADDAHGDLAPPSVKNETPARTHKRVKVEETKEVKVESNGAVIEQETKTIVKRARKSKAEKEADAMPLASRTASHLYNIGAHVSAAGGVDKAVTNAVHIGANSFALFLKSQRKWANPPLEPATAQLFHGQCAHHTFSADKHVVPHGSYLVNLAHPDPARTEQAYASFLDDIRRCETLGIGLYNFHPGNVQGVTRGEAIAHLARNLNRAHRETKEVVTLLENMAAGGNVLGSTFEDLAETIELVEDKSRVGICLDTCHAFAAGYDLRTKEALEETLERLDRVVGLKYLRAVHLNDSKAPFASQRDLHANIGTGFLGLRAFHGIMNEPRFEGLPIVLETPIEVYDDEGNAVKDEKGKDTKEDRGIWAREIKMLESLHGMDAESEEFKELEATLAARGQKERARVQDQVDRKAEKSKAKPTKKGKKKANASTSDEDSA